METNSPTEAEIQEAAAAIRAGVLVAFPTETVYGLGANAFDARAVDRVFQVKGRPPTSPLIVHVDSVAMARTVVAEWPDDAARLAEQFWPGPLTLVLPKQPSVPDLVTAGLKTVGVRMPAHPLALSLIRAAGVPIAAPSANRFTQLSPTRADHVRAGFNGSVEIILDGGPTDVGIESTVLSLAGPAPQLLRPGMISVEQIEAVIGQVSRMAPSIDGAHAAPGLHAKHYSPRTPLSVTAGELPAGKGAFLWWNKERAAAVSVQMPADPIHYAKRLYATLHSLDTEDLDFIAVEPVPATEEWSGIRDRLSRAAAVA